MPKIVITEKDLTTPGSATENFEVVYVPGLVSEKDGGKLEPRKPHLFTSVTEFEELCGGSPVKFDNTLYYSDLFSYQTDDAGNIEGTTFDFHEDAIPYDGVFLDNDVAYDPAYIMAKELLNAGMSVLYERMNPVEGDTCYQLQDKEPVDWKTTYKNYFVKAETSFETLEDNYKLVDQKLPPEFKSNFYYKKESPVYTDNLYELVNFAEESITGEAAKAKDYYREDGSKVDLEDLEELTPGTVYYTESGANREEKTVPYYHAAVENGYQMNTVQSIGDMVDDTTYFAFEVEKISRDEWDTSIPTSCYVLNDDILVEKSDFQDRYVALATKPEDWNSNFRDYYEHRFEFKQNEFSEFLVGKTYKYEDGKNLPYIYRTLADIFTAGNESGLVDKGNYSFKYLTSGGYPVYEYSSGSLVTSMLTLCADGDRLSGIGGRGDCVALIDHTDNPYRSIKLTDDDCLYSKVFDADYDKGAFGAMFTPWATYTRATSDHSKGANVDTVNTFRAPASFAYLMSLTKSLKTNSSWLAVAGATRGGLVNLADEGMTTVIPNGVADQLQPSGSKNSSKDGTAINAITEIKPYGNVIWGNRTLQRTEEALIASNFLNVRNMVSDIKKVCYRASRKLTFEQNNDILWVNFKSMIAPTLDRMLSGYGISGYKIVRDMTHEKAQNRATVCAKIIIHPVYPVEDFYITIVLTDDEVTVQE